MKFVQEYSSSKGFTMLEMLVGMMIIMIGIFGFAGMSIMMAKGNAQAKRLDEASTLLQSTLEEYSGVDWNDLGNDSGPSSPSSGLVNALVLTDGPLNHNGEEIGDVNAEGPFLFLRHVTICKEGQTVAGVSDKYCLDSLNGSNRPPELGCSGLGLSNREKMIRVVIAWSDRRGKCHKKHTDSLQFQ